VRYPVVNLRPRLGGMLEDYQNEINSLKTKLNAQRDAFSGYTPPPTTYPTAQPVPPPEPTPPPPPDTGGITYFHSGLGPISLPPTPPPAPPPLGPNDISVYQPPPPPPPPPSGLRDPYAPYAKVATGIPPSPYPDQPLPQPQDLPPLRPQPGTSCPKGTTWTPSGCLPDTPSIPNPPPVSQLPPTPTLGPTGMAPQASVNSTPSWNSAPGATNPYASVPSVDCGPGQFFDGKQCRGSVGGLPTIPGGLTSGGSPVTTGNFGYDPGAAAGATSVSMIGSVRIRPGTLQPSGVRPRMVRIVG
jgi:hypothetical protein